MFSCFWSLLQTIRALNQLDLDRAILQLHNFGLFGQTIWVFLNFWFAPTPTSVVDLIVIRCVVVERAVLCAILCAVDIAAVSSATAVADFRVRRSAAAAAVAARVVVVVKVAMAARAADELDRLVARREPVVHAAAAACVPRFGARLGAVHESRGTRGG